MTCCSRRTKIVATLGPASESPEVLERLVKACVNVVRLNFSHGSDEEHIRRAKQVREIAKKHGTCVGILADMQGPKIRIGRFVDGKTTLMAGQPFIIDAALDMDAGDNARVGITYKDLVNDVGPGARLLLNDGLIVMDVEKVQGKEIRCKVIVGGELSNNKGINREGGGLSARALTDKDRRDIRTAVRLKADYIAVSFPRDAQDIEEARALVREAGGHAGLIAKIERAEAVENLDEILAASDAVMVARGDLGVEIGDAAVPPAQKRIMRRAPKYNCPVIVATQMMESMITNPIPTRAEVNDVANAVLDGADAIMLSAETAAGKYPVETVEAMNRTCLATEKQNVLPSSSTRRPREHASAVDECIARQAMEMAGLMPIRAIAAFTQSGNTVLYMSRHLSAVPIYALTPLQTTAGRVTLFRNVTPKPVSGDYCETDAPQATRDALSMMLYDGLVTNDDMVLMTLGTPMGEAGRTNTMKVVNVGKAFH